MKSLLMIAVVFGVLLLFFASLMNKKKGGRATSDEKPRKKPLLLTEREQAMHNRLTQSVPDLIVLAQVSFSALLTAKSYGARNTFDRKVADFVVCDRAFQVLAVIELDDATHRTKKGKDDERDAMLMAAGYRVIRYPNIPDIAKVRADFMPPPLETQPEPFAQSQQHRPSDGQGARRSRQTLNQTDDRREPNLEP